MSCDAEGENDPCATSSVTFVLPTAGDALALRIRPCAQGAKRRALACIGVDWARPTDPESLFEIATEFDGVDGDPGFPGTCSGRAELCRDGIGVVLVREDELSEPAVGAISTRIDEEDPSTCSIALEYEEAP